MLVECKYIRYKKHNRDKASWTCVAHYKLRTTYPTVRKSIAVLVGDWTLPSRKLMRSFGIELVEVSFDTLARALKKEGIEFRWDEKDRDTPAQSVKLFEKLTTEAKQRIARNCLKDQRTTLEKLVIDAVSSSPTVPRSAKQIELLLKTNQDEYVLKKFTNVVDALTFLASLTAQKEDIGNIASPEAKKSQEKVAERVQNKKSTR